MRFSYEKCQYLQIGYTDKNVIYRLGNHIIKPSDSLCDLGVNINSNLKPSLHCSQIVSKANIRAKLILKCFLSHNQFNLIRAFKSYVRPLLEYCTVVWNPWLVQDIRLIESVQRTFTRKVCVLCNLPVMSYDERLKIFNLENLQLRRLHIDLVEMFKIVNGYSACNVKNVIMFYDHVTRGHRYKLVKISVNKNNFKYFLTNRVFEAWNSLPDACFNTNLISVFKARIARINFNKFILDQL
jgi:hypothetical protein